MKKFEDIKHLFGEVQSQFYEATGKRMATFLAFTDCGCHMVNTRGEEVHTSQVDDDISRAALASIATVMIRVHNITGADAQEFIQAHDVIFYDPQTDHIIFPTDSDNDDDRSWTVWCVKVKPINFHSHITK